MPDSHARAAADPATSSEALLAQVALGDRAAFEALYHRTARQLFGICLRVLSERAEAEEALQETYTSVWRRATLFDPTKAAAMSWLGMMARNKSIDRLRARPGSQVRIEELAQELSDLAASPAQQAETWADRERLERCLGELEPQRGALVRAAFFAGYTYQELAANLKEPLGSVKSRIRRALIQLRACLQS
jgi:RNA polymerase sigma-70 factor, ECF subfamily